MSRESLSLWQQFRVVFREVWHLPDSLPDRIDWWHIRRHAPVDVMGDQSVAVCGVCWVNWPCMTVLAASDRIEARAGA